MTNPYYHKLTQSLFDWFTTSDKIKNDLTDKFLSNIPIQASIKSHEDIILAGIEETEYFLKNYPGISFQKKFIDGSIVKKGEEIATISGNSNTILSLERITLNIVQRMSGITTQAHKFAEIAAPAYISATRKTPWMLLDKKAVAIGGGLTHRLDLSDGVLIKDNHLQILKNKYKLKNEEETVTQALQIILPRIINSSIEIEVNTPKGANATIKTFSQIPNDNHLIIMFDNWKAKNAQDFIKEINKNPDTSSIIFEASGNINENNLKDWAATGVDIISSGALTHSAKAADISLTTF